MKVLTQIAKVRDKRIAHNKTGQRLDGHLGELIREAFSQGHTGAEIAAAAGVSQARVYQIRDDRR